MQSIKSSDRSAERLAKLEARLNSTEPISSSKFSETSTVVDQNSNSNSLSQVSTGGGNQIQRVAVMEERRGGSNQGVAVAAPLSKQENITHGFGGGGGGGDSATKRV